jgi:adenine-specific DNA-methyltransferase
MMMAKRDYSQWEKQDLISQIERLEKRKKYGLVWDEEHVREEFEVQAKNSLPVLEEVLENAITNDPSLPTHILIEGDNFHALSVLNYTHEKMVDVIYIDPPYNTGKKSWKYNNKFVELDDAFKHSKWLTFMYKRLLLARHLLKDNGVIVVAIDDYELNQLGLIMNEIFGENNRLGIIVVVNKPSGRTTNSFFSTSHEYYYFYAKTQNAVSIAYWDLNEEQKEEYKFEDDISQFKWRDFLRTGGFSTPEERHNSFYPIFYNPESKQANIVSFPNAIEILPIDTKGNNRVWRRTRPSFMLALSKGEIQFSQNADGNWKVQIMDRIKSGIKPKSVWLSPSYDASAHGTKLLEQILRVPRSFDFPKSLYAVKDTLDILTRDNQDAVIVDFFAGSGTTAHAVMELNKEDGGNRRCILVTNNENNIMSEVCYPRVSRVISGYEYKGTEKTLLYEEKITLSSLKKAEKVLGELENIKNENKGKFDDLQSEFKNNILRLYGLNTLTEKKEGLGGNLKYYRTAFIPCDPSDENKELLTKKSTEMLCLRESTFDHFASNSRWKVYRNENHYTAIVFDQLAIPQLKDFLNTLDMPISIYVFSLEDNYFENEFMDMKVKVTTNSIPEAILRVYRRIYR